MALPRITQKEMTEREQRELKTLLDRARIAHGRPLTNAETNSVKKEYIDKLMLQREAEAKKARQLKKNRHKSLFPEAARCACPGCSAFIVGCFPACGILRLSRETAHNAAATFLLGSRLTP